MIGLAPIFYRIPVNTALIEALKGMVGLDKSITVYKYIPPVPNSEEYLTEGMQPLANRHIIFQCFEAFKRDIVSHPYLHCGT
jgi:hypothetical protein